MAQNNHHQFLNDGACIMYKVLCTMKMFPFWLKKKNKKDATSKLNVMPLLLFNLLHVSKDKITNYQEIKLSCYSFISPGFSCDSHAPLFILNLDAGARHFPL